MRRSRRAGNADGQTPANKPGPRGTRPVYRNARVASVGRSPIEALESRTLLAGNGLAATYYNGIDFTGGTASRIDARVNFDWAAGAPADTIDADTFSVLGWALFMGKIDVADYRHLSAWLARGNERPAHRKLMAEAGC